MKKFLLIGFLAGFIGSGAVKAQGNYAASGAEFVNYGTIDLATPGGQTWSTDRSANPGYFSAYFPSATYSNASDANNVNGYVKKYGNEAYTFPVGSGTDLRTLSISAPASSSDAYATAWIAGDPSGSLDPTGPNAGAHATTSVGTGILSVSKTGQWDWQAISGTGAGLTITVSIPDLSTFATAANLRLVGWNGTQWVNLGSSGATGNTQNSLLSGTMISGITAIGVGSVAFVLPVNITAFDVAEVNCNASLAWTSAAESNITAYVIEQSVDGIYFKTAATIDARYPNAGGQYKTSVAQATTSAYYRLKMVERDGHFDYSKIISLRKTCKTAGNYLLVYPNPSKANNDITLELAASYKGSSNITITNMAGQKVLAQTEMISEGINLFHINVKGLSSGTYYLQLSDASGHVIGTMQKIIKL